MKTYDWLFRISKNIQNTEGYYVMIKGLIIQEDITVLKMYMPNNRISNYMRQQLEEDVDETTIIVGDFNIPFS